ncbi:MAG: TerB family tellurite resistance protein [Geitlerinemataceae cyanobacterium]
MATVPSPPSISPKQMAMLRIVAAMAWADGHLAEEEVAVAVDSFSEMFARDTEHQMQLREELRDYLMQNLPLDTLVPQLETREERELVLKLSYKTIAASARSPYEPTINAEEVKTYAALVRLLALPDEVVQAIEERVDRDSLQGEDWLANINGDLTQLANDRL